MEIKATTIYDLKTIQALLRLQIFKKSNPKKNMQIWMIIATVLSILIILELIAFGNSAFLWGLLVLLILVTLLHFYLYFLLPKIQYKSLKNFADIQNIFIFREYDMSVSSSVDNYEDYSTLKYNMLFKAMETSDYFFVFLTKLHVYVVDKSTLEGGTVSDIRQVLMGTLGAKYIICQY